MPEKSLTEQLAATLPQALAQEPAVASALERVRELEQRASTLAAQQAFLERAPREGLQFPGDALKLIDAAKLADLDAAYAELRRGRPWLFRSAASPAAEKLALAAPEIERMREAVKHGALSRGVQALRPIKRVRS
ncbi:MAG: hypothetical protein HUU03_05965 [Planctomycetaceae bacterium]|nr:hypothetical protein [Planctomycetota bacterium]NUO15970.1 hypothetical protein [Planctomycetaceae bacterium]GIK52513.1 MAG: hypothetical protein BroJett014_14860 [Planctomycetota bacterium]